MFGLSAFASCAVAAPIMPPEAVAAAARNNKGLMFAPVMSGRFRGITTLPSIQAWSPRSSFNPRITRNQN